VSESVKTAGEKLWQITLLAATLGVIGSILWLDLDFVKIAGGSVTLILTAYSAASLRRSLPFASMLLAGLFVLEVSLLAVNMVAGLSKTGAISDPKAIVLTTLLFVVGVSSSVWMMLSPASGDFDSIPKPTESRQQRKVVAALFFTVAVLVGMAGGALQELRPHSPTVFGSVAVGGLFTFWLVAVVLHLRHRLDTELVSRRKEAASRVTWVTLPWLVLGFPVELLRGEWVLWTLTVGTVVSALLLSLRYGTSQIPQPKRRGVKS
jgi:hypothetical protein